MTCQDVINAEQIRIRCTPATRPFHLFTVCVVCARFRKLESNAAIEASMCNAVRDFRLICPGQIENNVIG